jgi:dolichyl-phosphate-mannose--protein O-mannosyl transferase
MHLVKLLEVQRQDTAMPLDERWPEIRKWLKASAGKTSGKLAVPGAIRKDLIALVECRNRVVHDAYRAYQAALGTVAIVPLTNGPRGSTSRLASSARPTTA